MERKLLLVMTLVFITTVLSAQSYIFNNAGTWKAKADKQNKIFTTEQNKEAIGFTYDKSVMYKALMDMYEMYLAADSLYREIEKDGVDESDNIKYIANTLASARPSFINAALDYFNDTDYEKSNLCFKIYLNYPNLKIFTDERTTTLQHSEQDVLIKYYAAITALQAGKYDKAIKELTEMAENYTPNDNYKERDIYEYLTQAHQSKGNSTELINFLAEISKKFPDNEFIVLSLINEYLANQQFEVATKYIDNYVKYNPERRCELISLKGTMMTHISDFKNAEKFYKEALKKDKSCLQAIEGLGVMHVLIAQNLTQNEDNQNSKNKKLSTNQKKAKKEYKKSLPYLTKYYDLLKTQNVNKNKLSGALYYLQNVYYNLSTLGDKKSFEKYDEVDREKDLLYKSGK